MNVQEVINITKQRKTRLKDITLKILENIHKKIKYYALHKHETCSYIIPAIMDDTPIYDRTTLTKDLFKILDQEGYIVTAFENGQLNICWNEKLVQKKVNCDRYILTQEEKRLNKYNKNSKIINDRFSFLSNPAKTITEPTLEEKVDREVEKYLKQKDKQQNLLAKSIGNFTKI
jgi:hypothetical protein